MDKTALHRQLGGIALVLSILSCSKLPESQADEPEEDVTESATSCLENLGEDKDVLSDDVIPDFSRVGYKYGDEDIPTLPVAATISLESVSEALSSGAATDTSAYIQSVIDKVGTSGGGAILLKNGTYNVGRILFIDYDNTVLRGESESGTVLLCHGTTQRPCVTIGKTQPFSGEETASNINISGRLCFISSMMAAGAGGASSFGTVYINSLAPRGPSVSYTDATEILDDYVPVGSLSVKVRNPEMFAIGDHISIYRPHSAAWLHDIGMDRIASNGREGISPTVQWTEKSYAMRWSRRVTAVKGSRICLDAPIVQALDKNYGGGTVYRMDCPRVYGSGVENLTIDSVYDPSLKDSYGRCIDENHTWRAVRVAFAENCWIRSVTSRHMGMSLAALASHARCITVEDCTSLDPVSVVNGGRRYAFSLGGCELCLIKNCVCEKDRHGCVTNSTGNPGPNVFTQCTGKGMLSEMGSHQGWATGTLFDCVKTDNQFAVQDRGNYGNGHGWAGANEVFWNIEATIVTCQSPWAPDNTPSLEFSSTHRSARNYAVGVICNSKSAGRNINKDYYGNYVDDYYKQTLGFENRPDGEWYPKVEVGAAGTAHVFLPDAEAAATYAWWPSLGGVSYSNPQSLYECQLEERHRKGIYLNTL